MYWSVQPAALNNHRPHRFPALRAYRLDLPHNRQPLFNLAKNHVLAIQPRRGLGADEKLRAVSIRSRVGHGHDARLGVLELEVLVVELLPVDGLAAGAVPVGEVAALAHEFGDDPVEGRAPIAKALLPGAEDFEVLAGFGHVFVVEADDDLADPFPADGHFEVDSGSERFFGGDGQDLLAVDAFGFWSGVDFAEAPVVGPAAVAVAAPGLGVAGGRDWEGGIIEVKIQFLLSKSGKGRPKKLKVWWP